jgi:hypothetical protein
MSGVRRAAVALYGLHRDDREAILAELSTEQQGLLRAALIELESLGFARTISVVLREDDAAAAGSAQANGADGGTIVRAPHAVSGEERSMAQLRHADSAQLCAVLSGEPISFIAEALLLASWPWADAVVACLPETQRSQLRGQMTGLAPIPAARAAWLLNALAQRVAALPSAPAIQPVTAVMPNARKPLRAPKWLRSIVWPA